MKHSAILTLVLGLVLGAALDSRGQNKYEKYARWWNQKVHSKTKFTIKRDKNGKRLGRVFKVPTNPPAVSAAKAEREGVVQDPTFVLGVEIDEHARAYPIHALGFELLNGKALSGPQKGKQLKPLIAIPIRSSRYRGLYPDGEVYRESKPE